MFHSRKLSRSDLALISGTFSGQFAILDTSAFSGVTFSTLYDSHDVTLKVIAVNAVPLPTALWLFGSALISMTLIGFRKKDLTIPNPSLIYDHI